MFQNVTNNVAQEDDDEIRENRINLLLKELFSPKNWLIYILTFLLSMIKIKTGVLPFGLAIVGACLGSTIPIFMVYIISIISVAVFHGGSDLADYFYTSLIFFATLIMFKPKISTDDRNEVFKVGTKLFLASFIYLMIKSIRTSFEAYDVFIGFIISSLIYVFYKIFVNGIVVIKDHGAKRAFTVEEIIGAVIIFTMAILVFKDVKIFEQSISNVLAVVLIVIIGCKSGTLVGFTTALSVGTVLNLFGNLDSFQLIIFTLIGIVSGIFSKFIPSRFKFDIEKIFPKENLLANSGEHRLNYYEEIKEKINAVAQTISDMNNNFFINNQQDSDDLNKEVYIDNFLDLIENYPQNIFYDDLINNNFIIGDFFDYLEKDDIITEKEMLEVFKSYSNYILLRDQKLKEDFQEIIKIANRCYRELQINSVKVKLKKEEANKLEKELKNVSKIITDISKPEENVENKVIKEKEIMALLKGKAYPIKKVKVNICKNGKYIITLKLDNKNNELKNRDKITNIENLISKSINMKCSFEKDKKDLEKNEYYQVYSSDDKFSLQVGSYKISKNGDGTVSGDSNLQMRLTDGKYLLAISDGMGSGEKAKKASKFVINSLNTLLSKGFEQEETIKLINSELNFNKDSEMYATVDMAVLDLFKGNLLLSKNGACNTYIKTKKGVNIFKGENLPVGIVDETSLDVQETELNDGDIILMCSDGLLECGIESKSDWVQEFLGNINVTNVQKIADLIVNEAVDNCYGIPKDDITVIVAKIVKKR